MIPKKLHFCHYGSTPMTPLNVRCIQAAARILTDWHHCFWHVDNLPDVPLVHRALRERPVAASEFMRMWLLRMFGGVYIDNDVELVKPFPDDLMKSEAFIGYQRNDSIEQCLNPAVIGSLPGHPFPALCEKRMLDMDPASIHGPSLVTDVVRNGLPFIGGITICSKEVFFPWRWDEKPKREMVKDKTIALHWWEGAWNPADPRPRYTDFDA